MKLDIFLKNALISKFMKIHPVETNCSMQTDMTKLIVNFCNFVNVPKSADLHPHSK